MLPESRSYEKINEIYLYFKKQLILPKNYKEKQFQNKKNDEIYLCNFFPNKGNSSVFTFWHRLLYFFNVYYRP